MTKLKVINVKKCADFYCPFFYAGIMGSEECGATDYPYKDLSKHKGKIPKWCPIKNGEVVVKLNLE